MYNKNVFCLFFLLVLFAYSIPVFSWPIPDTGQTKCYDNFSEIPCPNIGEPFYGQDANYSINPKSYTKLDAYGNDLEDSAAGWVMVRDNVTGLIWEVKTYDDSVHDKDSQYTFDDAQNVFIKALNDENFGGYSDWRMPTIKELASITNKGKYKLAIDDDYFQNTHIVYNSEYWSSIPYVHSPCYAWVVDFCYGYDGHGHKSSSNYVRAVRGGQSWSFDNLVINGDPADGTVTDNNTGLMWQQAIFDQRMTWEDALAYCENLDLAGYDDWRLPTVEELRSIVDYSIDYSAVYVDIFPDTKSAVYWSSTTYAYGISRAWGVYFFAGYDYYGHKSSSYYVRAVRSINSLQSENLIISCTANQTSGGAPFEVTLTTTVLSGNPEYTFSYDFGDGTSGSSEQNVVHTYTNPGTYFPSVTVTDSQGQTATQSVTIIVSEPIDEEQKPTASILTNSLTGTVPFTVLFIGLGTDPEGQSLLYSWDFGDSQTGEGMITSHIYTDIGTYTATLTVTNPEGISDTASVNITAQSDTSSSVKINLNKSEYTFGEKLVISATLNGNEEVDLYVVFVFPAGYFMSITYPLSFNMPGDIIAYQTGIELSGEQTFSIMDIELTKDLSLGTYGVYSLITTSDSDPWDLDNWIHYDFKTFELK